MSEIYRAAIVGGGFSGLVAAAVLSGICGGENILLLEKNERVGKKILATGNGRCNLTNRDLSLRHYHSVAGASGAVKFEKFGNESMIGFFRDLGILMNEEDGKIYPASLQAGRRAPRGIVQAEHGDRNGNESRFGFFGKRRFPAEKRKGRNV